MKTLLLIALTAIGGGVTPLPCVAQASQEADLATRVRSSVVDALAARAPGAIHRLEVRVVRAPSNLEAGQSLEASLPDEPVVPRGKVQVSLRVDGMHSAWAVVEIAHFDSVAVPLRALATGEEVTASDIQFLWMETTRFSGDPLTRSLMDRMEDATPQARRALRVDRPLRAGDVGPRPAAETGDPIRMTYSRGGFLLEMNCRARDRGQTGQIIRVYADDSDTMYRARLTSPGRAEWVQTL